MPKMLNAVLLVSFLISIIPVPGCKRSAKDHRVQFVERSAVSSRDMAAQPLALIIEIDEGGRLRLNKIETGTVTDPSLLSEKLEIIFADREKAGIGEREVLIDPKVNLETEGFEELFAALADVKASPISVIKNNH